MYKVEKTVSGSLKCGPDLYARKCEGGYEVWRAKDSCGHRTWVIGGVMEKDYAIGWLKSWGKEIYNERS